MKVALINCPPSNIEENRTPLGLEYVAAYAKKRGHKVFLFDLAQEFYNKIGLNLGDLFKPFYMPHWWQTSNFLKIHPLLEIFYEKKVDDILKTDARIIGFSVFPTQVKSSLLLAEMIKRKDKKRIIVFGGPAWFFQAKEILLNNDCVDAVVVGEGELTFDELIRSVEKTGKINIIPGLMTKKNEKLCYGGERPQVKNLDNLPFPFFSGLPIKEYKVYETASSRGCPFNCSFCNTKNFWPCFRYRSAKNIFQEIKAVNKKYKISSFYFVDSLIDGNVKELSELCDLIIKSKLKIKWISFCTVRKELDAELLTKMAKAGCYALALGLESGSQKVLHDMKKQFTVEMAERTLRDAYHAGIDVKAAFIVGFPTENTVDFLKTIFFLVKNRKLLYDVFLSPSMIYPKTDLYENPDNYGIDEKTLTTSYWDIGLWKTKNRKNTIIVRSVRFMILYSLLKLLNLEIASSGFTVYRFYLKSLYSRIFS